MQLSETTEEQIDALAQEGNALLDGMSDWEAAISTWQRALDLLPIPSSQWPQAVWLMASIGAAWRMGGDNARAFDAFDAAYRALDGHLNPFVLVNLGALLIGTDDGGGEPLLLRAFMLEGNQIFDDDPKALAFLSARVDLRTEPRINPSNSMN